MLKIKTLRFYEPDGAGTGGSTEPQQGQQQEPQQDTPKYTDKQLNDLIAKNKNKALDDFVRGAGFENTDALSAALGKLKDMKEKNKSDSDKLIEERDALKKQLEEARGAASLAEFRAEALAAGVNSESAAKVAKWAQDYEGDTAAAKVESFLKDNPGFIKQDTGAKAPAFGSKTVNQKPDAEAELLETIKKNMRG